VAVEVGDSHHLVEPAKIRRLEAGRVLALRRVLRVKVDQQALQEIQAERQGRQGQATPPGAQVKAGQVVKVKAFSHVRVIPVLVTIWRVCLGLLVTEGSTHLLGIVATPVVES
jgi:hypothetical protein